MSLDTKWRPRVYADLLGQKATVQILQRLIATGQQFRQSYLFAGPYGSGKTTTARIFARAMLCDAPANGDPCDKCPSCLSILAEGSSENLVEVDAATNSGKDAVRKVLEEIEYLTFSGKRRIYLYDEAHQLTRDALDAMLKPMEENFGDTPDKRLICIFCTTEPEKMRATILSRCAPAFVIHPVSPATVAARLATICQAEGLDHDVQALHTIAELTECHVRDCLKAIEGVSMLGSINAQNVTTYLHLDRNILYLDVLDALGADFDAVSKSLTALSQQASAATCYEKIAEAALLAYKVVMRACPPPVYWDAARVQQIGARLGAGLLAIAGTLSSRPGRPTMAMLECDLAYLHHRGRAPVAEDRAMAFMPAASGAVAGPVPIKTPALPSRLVESVGGSAHSGPVDGKVGVPAAPGQALSQDGVFVNGKAIRQPTARTAGSLTTGRSLELDATTFMQVLSLRVGELDEAVRGSAGRPFLDRD